MCVRCGKMRHDEKVFDETTTLIQTGDSSECSACGLLMKVDYKGKHDVKVWSPKVGDSQIIRVDGGPMVCKSSQINENVSLDLKRCERKVKE